jgi:hypothetical protein
MTTHTQSDDFDIAKEIFDQLKDLPLIRTVARSCHGA